ncbi:Prevent-host-death family protein [Acidithiobacillus ferrivorans]|uniref:Prevent-host-death family protein n=1 Tax=Acidithiobacillus ferrivorans TaxID=160808 RepID=A0A060UT50_9PROT|nr:type II toxin-antitoxin system prevent-host-death family antitoxin [Acidithiobacillus ferrivorans]CDQ09759.1 Prevent-host-death family protein [Acidithiobacillus ferrivorans]SMH66427.1 Prevent-host-death family protein [Acidithiobacillus ferrivorans]
MAIQHVSLRETNQHLSKYIEMASHGSEIIVTKRGWPVARIAPIEVGGLMSDAEKYRIVSTWYGHHNPSLIEGGPGTPNMCLMQRVGSRPLAVRYVAPG